MSSEDPAKIHGKVFYLADYEPIDILYWAQLIAERFGSHTIYELPLPAMRVCAKVGDCLKAIGVTNPPLFSSRLNNLLTSAVFDLRPIKEIAGAEPFSLQRGVAITVEWMRQYVLSGISRPTERVSNG